MQVSSHGQSRGGRPLLSDAGWRRIVDRLPAALVTRAKRNEWRYRGFVNDVLWVASNNVVWHALKPEEGSWRKIYVRFLRWSDKGVWEEVAEALGPGSPLSAALLQRVEEHRDYRERCANVPASPVSNRVRKVA